MNDLIYKQLSKKILMQKDKNYQYVFLCIGTEKVIGDLYGPLVGQKLYENFLKKQKNNVVVYGKIGENVVYSNIKSKIEKINSIHNNPYIIAIDSAISEEKNIGKIIVSSKKIKIGEAIRKKRI